MRRAVAVLALVMTACGGGAGTGESSEPDGTSATTVGAAESGELTLADFFGGSDDPAEAEARYREQEADIQERIRVCMAEEGFDYIPVEPPEGSFYVGESQEEYAAKRGFGITTWVGNEEEFSGPEVEWTDPNQETVDAMSESEQEAYYEALHGSEEENRAREQTEIDPESGEEVTYVEGFGAGCYGEAQEAVYGNQEDLWTELGPELEAMYERMQADPRIDELNKTWSECMAGKGYDYESQEKMYEAVYEDFQTRLDAIVGPNGGYVDPFEGWTEEEISAFFEEKTEDEINAFFEQANNTEPDYDKEALAALQQEEIDLAVAAAECSTDFEEVFAEVSKEYEAEFIEANRSQLEEIKASQG
ncbi:MAG: hypothetical protein OEW30_12735 [Acidimicrobiia bacterium]|nr:hypothetical protein [Acidimicrobiia bacterium]